MREDVKGLISAIGRRITGSNLLCPNDEMVDLSDSKSDASACRFESGFGYQKFEIFVNLMYNIFTK